LREVREKEIEKSRGRERERERERDSLFGACLHARKPRILPFNYPGSWCVQRTHSPLAEHVPNCSVHLVASRRQQIYRLIWNAPTALEHAPTVNITRARTRARYVRPNEFLMLLRAEFVRSEHTAAYSLVNSHGNGHL